MSRSSAVARRLTFVPAMCTFAARADAPARGFDDSSPVTSTGFCAAFNAWAAFRAITYRDQLWSAVENASGVRKMSARPRRSTPLTQND